MCRIDVLRFVNPEHEPRQTDSGELFISWLATLSSFYEIPAQGKIRGKCHLSHQDLTLSNILSPFFLPKLSIGHSPGGKYIYVHSVVKFPFDNFVILMNSSRNSHTPNPHFRTQLQVVIGIFKLSTTLAARPC